MSEPGAAKVITKTKPIVFKVRKKSVEMVQSLEELIKDAQDVLESLKKREDHQKFSISFVVDDPSLVAESVHHVKVGGCSSRIHFDCNNGG